MRLGLFSAVLAACSVGIASAKTMVNARALILATDTSGNAITSTLDAYGIRYDNLVLPDSGYILPSLTNSDGSCKYGAIVIFRQLFSTDSKGNWVSFIGTDQWTLLWTYQQTCGVRMIHLGVVPETWDFSCNIISSTSATENNNIYSNNDQFFLDTTVASAEFPWANLKNPTNARFANTWHTPGWCDDSLLPSGMTSQNVFLYSQPITVNTPASGTQATTNKPALGVINRFSDGREHMAFFTAFAQWAEASIYMNHIWINWAFRGIIPGRRAVFLGLQIDDLLLPTAVYAANYTYRITPSDVANHANWQPLMNQKLASSNPGSEIFLEFGFNGNGAFIYDQGTLGLVANGTCPVSVVYTAAQPVTALEYVKPPGTGNDLWPVNQTYNWPDKCIFYDPLAKMFSQNNTGGTNVNGVSDIFALVSHTFTHEGENPITYNDAVREIQYNQQFQKKSFFDQAKRFSSNGIIPPAITGLHNADAIKAWMDNGIKFVVGDNTRPPLRNQQSDRWPVISTTADNGYPGLVIIPRWASRIYFNADGVASDLQEWLDVSPSQATNSMTNLLSIERATTAQYLLGLYHDPFMFHQANLRVWSDTGVQINGVTTSGTGPWSLIQMWTESILNEFTQYVNWPIRSFKHDDLGADYLARMNRDLYSGYTVNWITSDDMTTITGFTVAVTNSSWVGEVPVMIPGAVTSTGGARVEQIGTEPTILWVSSFPTTYTLKTPINIRGSKVNVASSSQVLTTTGPTLSLPTTSLVGSFSVSAVLTGASTLGASLSASLSASAKASGATSSVKSSSSASSSASSAKTSSSSASSAKSTATSSSSVKASSSSSSVKTSSGSSSASSSGTKTSSVSGSATSTNPTSTSSTASASPTPDVSVFLNSLCANSTNAANFGNLCQLWSAFKTSGTLTKRGVFLEDVAGNEMELEGGHVEAHEKRKKRGIHQSHKRGGRHH
ncbi:hypothetical protein TWF694_002916 [Orbilia ellipsospora]|uniref:Extracellular serine-rich protein n=1 Tax=Orbilia ellipsospora TaxID=2528407 RepID=A0AAV9X072_9PEZI